ncbi:MAG: hypothetical protein PHG23_00705, partial [Candidatus Pacebacteria bacterium]|nr:hypothetical protein [Candidatus Paceibacterota bacterium]
MLFKKSDQQKINAKMSTKKFGLVAGILFALSVMVTPVFAACDLQHLDQCDTNGLLALIASLGAAEGTPTGSTGSLAGIPAGFQFTQNLKQGSTGTEVRYLQIFLNSDPVTKIATTGAGSPGNETTYFGALTKAAVNKFQAKYAADILAPIGLTNPTGNWASRSREEANEILAGGTEPENPTCPTTAVACVTAGYNWNNGVCSCSGSVPSGTYSVALASDTPAASVLASGSAFNDVLKVAVSAGTTAQSITSITIQRTGLSLDSNVTGVVVVDAAGVRHGNIVTFAAGTATITFTSAPITIPAGTVQEITIQYNMDPLAVAGTVGARVSAMSGNPTGLPVTGNTFTLTNGAATVGTMSVRAVQISAGANVLKDVGTSGYDIAKFSFQAGAQEDMLLKSVTFFQNGTAADGDVVNLRLVAPDGTILSTVTQTTNRYVTFNMSAAPYRIAKGLTKNLTVRIDIFSGSARTVQFIVQNNYDVVATGASTGISTLACGGAGCPAVSAYPVGNVAAFNTVLINAGSLVVSKSTTSPSGTIGVGTTNQTLATWKFEARGEDIEVRSAVVYIGGTGATVNNAAPAPLAGTVRLVTDDGSTIASVDPTLANLVLPGNNVVGHIITLSSFYTIPAGTTKNISLVVDTGTLLPNNTTLFGKISDIAYRQVSTNSFATYALGAGAAINGNTLTASAATLNVVTNNAIGNKTVVAGQAGALIGSYLLQTNATEGVNVSTVAITLTGDGGGIVATGDVTNLTLKKSDGTVLGQSISTPTIGLGAPGAVNSFTVAGQLNIPVSTTVQVDVYGDINTTGTALGTVRTGIPQNNVIGVGATSGADATGPAAGAILGQLATVSAGGNLTASIDTSAAPASQFLTTGLAGVELAKIKLAATVENMLVSRLDVSTINGSGNIAQIKLLGTGLATDPVAPLTGGNAIFTFPTGSELTVPAYGTKVLTLAADTTNLGTLTPGALAAVGFEAATVVGAGSGQTVQPTVTGVIYPVENAGTFIAAPGDVIYFPMLATAAGAGAITAPGYYMVTTNAPGDNLSVGGVVLNGAAAASVFQVGDRITLKAGGAGIDVIAAGPVTNNVYAKGDIVYLFDFSAPANSGFHVVTAAQAAGVATINLNGHPAFALDAAGDIITRFGNAVGMVSNTMQFEEVEPVMTKDASSPSGSLSPTADQPIAMFDIQAKGSRDLLINAFTVEKSGNNNPAGNVVHFKLYNGSNLLSEVTTTSKAAAGAVAAIAAGVPATLADMGTIADTTGIQVGDTLSYALDAAPQVILYTAKVTAVVLNTSVTLDTLYAGHGAAAAHWYNNRVHFDLTSSTPLPQQNVTAGETAIYTVKADTSNVKASLGAGLSANLTLT